MSDVETNADWLERLSKDEWLHAAKVELGECLAALRSRQQRKAVAAGRRAAGMALNAVLRQHPNEAWGRSYVEHLRAVEGDASVPEVVRDSARELLEAPLEGPKLIRLGGADESLAAAAATVVDWSEARLSGDA